MEGVGGTEGPSACATESIPAARANRVKIRDMRFLNILFILAFLGGVAPAVRADMPQQKVTVTRSSGSTADVQVETRTPGQTQPPAKKASWITRTLRFLQQVLTGSIFIG